MVELRVIIDKRKKVGVRRNRRMRSWKIRERMAWQQRIDLDRRIKMDRQQRI